MNEPIKALMIIGQTCSGKESLSLKLAEYLKTDIISMDSMKIYKGMDIGTAKAPLEARKRITHHLIDTISPSENYNVSDYIRDATSIAYKIYNEKKIPLFSGGTSLYAKGLFSGLFTMPPISPEIKLNVENEYDQDKEKAYKRLKFVDPEACKKIFINDRQRVTRALEVFDGTNKPISNYQNQFGTSSDIFQFLTIGIRWPREILHKRIAQRVHWMIEIGLEDEVKKMHINYPNLGKGSSKAVGYQELIAYFNETCSKEEAIERIIINTRQLCKHQMTWMRKFPINWIDVDESTKSSEIVEKSLLYIKQSFLKSYLL
jgi:tRNA dimethylallyltransferase